MTEETPSPIQQATDILRLSNDGNDLSDLELRVVELAVNGRLNEQGKAFLAALRERLATLNALMGLASAISLSSPSGIL
jgi:hypothetical protein